MKIVKVQPGNTQVLTGHPLDLTVLAEAPTSLGEPPARIIFGEPNDVPPPADAPARPADGEMRASPAGAGAGTGGDPLAGDVTPGYAALRYTYHVEHVDRTVRYRVEVGGTQSDWYTASVIRAVKLEEMSFRIEPPSYTKQEARTLRIKAADLAKTPVTAPQGSRVEVAAVTDIPWGHALLQTADTLTATPMAGGPGGRAFTAAFVVVQDTPVSVMLTDAGGQRMFKLPEEPLVVRCENDASPRVEMRWPRQDVVVPLDAEIKVAALLSDDYGLASARVLTSAERPATPTTGPARADEAAWVVANEQPYPAGSKSADLSFVLNVDPALRKHDNVISVRVEATDNRDLGPGAAAALAGDRKNVDPRAWRARRPRRRPSTTSGSRTLPRSSGKRRTRRMSCASGCGSCSSSRRRCTSRRPPRHSGQRNCRRSNPP